MRDLSRTKTQTKPKFFSSFKINMLLLSMILGLGLVYVFSINSIATANYQIKRMSTQLSQLDNTHKDLELKNSTLQSVATIQAETSQLNLIPADKMMYLRDDNVALR